VAYYRGRGKLPKLRGPNKMRDSVRNEATLNAAKQTLETIIVPKLAALC
jgi:hypothetical protein